MGLMDRVKQQAPQLAQKLQEAAQEGKEKLDQVQAKRRADAMFRELGAAVYAERTNRATADTPAKIERLVKALTEQEAAQGLGDDAPGAGPAAPGAGASAPGAGTSAPGAGTSAPGAGTSAPGAGTSAPTP
jgi:hypothetical protein